MIEFQDGHWSITFQDELNGRVGIHLSDCGELLAAPSFSVDQVRVMADQLRMLADWAEARKAARA